MSEAAKRQEPIPEDEEFLSDEDLFERAYQEKHGASTPQDAEERDAGAAKPEGSREPESEEPQPREGESSSRGDDETAEDDTPAWLNELPDEARDEYIRQQQELTNLRNQYNSVHNRLAPVQQENARLRQQLSGKNPSPANGQNSQAAPVGQSQSPVKFSLDDVEEFKEFRDSFPDEAKAMEAALARQAQYVGNLESQLSEVRQGMQTIQRSSYETARQNELQRLSEAHPDWATVRPSEDFNDWLETQPESVAQLASSAKAEDCIWVLDRYKMDVYLYQQTQNGEQAGQSPDRDSRAQQTRERRQRLRSVPNPHPQQDGGVGAPQMGGVAMSDEDIWAQEVERRLRAQRQANR